MQDMCRLLMIEKFIANSCSVSNEILEPLGEFSMRMLPFYI